MRAVHQSLFQDPEERKVTRFCSNASFFSLTFKEGPAQLPQGIVLQNLRKVLHIKVEKALTKAKGKKIFVWLLSSVVELTELLSSKLLILFYYLKENSLEHPNKCSKKF